MAISDDFEAAISHGCGIDGEENGKVFDFSDVRVGR